MKYKITLEVYNDNFEPICFEGLTSTKAIYNACKKVVSYCQSQLNYPIVVEIFMWVNGSVMPIYVGDEKIGIGEATSIYRIYTAIINKLGEVL